MKEEDFAHRMSVRREIIAFCQSVNAAFSSSDVGIPFFAFMVFSFGLVGFDFEECEEGVKEDFKSGGEVDRGERLSSVIILRRISALAADFERSSNTFGFGP